MHLNVLLSIYTEIIESNNNLKALKAMNSLLENRKSLLELVPEHLCSFQSEAACFCTSQWDFFLL